MHAKAVRRAASREADPVHAMSPDLDRLIKLQQLDSTIEDARRKIAAHPQRLAEADARLNDAKQRVGRRERSPQGQPGNAPRARERRRRLPGTHLQVQGPAGRRQDQPEYQAHRPRDRDRAARPRRRRGEGARADDGRRRHRRRHQAGRSRARDGPEGNRRREDGARPRSWPPWKRRWPRRRRRARRCVAQTDPRLLAMFEQVAKARKGIAICAPRATACARRATSGCVRRSSSRSGRTTPSSSATAASESSTTCLPRPRRSPPSPTPRDRGASQPSLFGAPGGGSAIANIDGGVARQPGPAGYGVRIERDDGTVVELKEAVGVATNNVAEYRGLLAALAWAAQQRHRDGCTSSRIRDLLVKQMRGEYRVKHPGCSRSGRRPAAWRGRFARRAVRARAPRVQQGRRPPGERGDGRSGCARMTPAIRPAFSFSARNDVSTSRCIAVHSPQSWMFSSGTPARIS